MSRPLRLTSQRRRNCSTFLRQLQQERDVAIVFISHDLSLVRYLTSRVYVMSKGEIVESGDTLNVFEQPQHEYTRLLISSIPGRREKA